MAHVNPLFGRSVAVAATILLVMLGLVSATYADSASGSMTVSCNNDLLGTGMTVFHDSKGTFRIRNDGSGGRDTRVTARSANGNDLTTKVASQGERVSWTNVLRSNYTVKARISGASQNCNGAYPGNGNYILQYTVFYE